MKYLFIIVFLLSISKMFGQENRRDISYTKTELTKVLNELETLFDVKFSYLIDIVENKEISLNMLNASIDEIIYEIEERTKLFFDKIDERYYIVRNNYVIEVCGYVIDIDSGNPIEGANIINKTKRKGTSSNKNGFFSIRRVNVLDSLTISFLGYKTIRVAAKNSTAGTCSNYAIEPTKIILNEVITKGGFLRTKWQDDGAISLESSSMGSLSGSPEPDILQNIQSLPGINSPLETASGLYFRGSTPDQNLILWDGIKMYNADHFFGSTSIFNPYITKDITIYKNGVKPEYGNSVAGVIHMKTDTTISKRVVGGLGLNSIFGDAYLKIPVGRKMGMIIGFRRSLSDVLSTKAFDNFTKRIIQPTTISDREENLSSFPSISDTRFRFSDITLKLIAEISNKDKVIVSNLFAQNRLSNDFEVTDPNINVSLKDRLRIKNEGLVASWRRNWSDNFLSKTEIYYSSYDFDYEGEYVFPTLDLLTNKKNTVRETGVRLHGEWDVDKRIVISGGYQFQGTKINFFLEDTFESRREDRNNPVHAIYGQANLVDIKKWNINLGFRINQYSKLDRILIEPRIYIEKKLGDFTLKTSGEYRSQSVSQITELTTPNLGLNDVVWVSPDENNNFLYRSRQASIGFLYTKKGWNIDCDVYHKKIKGITSLIQGFEALVIGLERFNFFEGNSTHNGLELLVEKKISNYTTLIGYNYTDVDFNFKDLNQGASFPANNAIKHSFTWSHFYQLNKIQFSLAWNYRTGTPFTPPVRVIPVGDSGALETEYGSINSDNLPDYHRLDFSTGYNFEMSKGKNPIDCTLGVGIQNIYNRKNVLNRLYQVENSENPTFIALDDFSLEITTNFFVRFNL
ncbi:TonB-dependent receptor [Aquimarina sp. 2304DJ70-9]|uniref:TonB-dependent receptor n=1 Tax=Aquimarina penaris TaxID=3231044 RepID=UPI0034621A81